jgi:hypothetical protein
MEAESVQHLDVRQSCPAGIQELRRVVVVSMETVVPIVVLPTVVEAMAIEVVTVVGAAEVEVTDPQPSAFQVESALQWSGLKPQYPHFDLHILSSGHEAPLQPPLSF